MSESADGYVDACALSDLPVRKGKKVEVNHRTVALFRVSDSEVYCIDEHCYHESGLLHVSDIEDMPGHSCIKCPIHGYIIDIKTGEGLYKKLNGSLASKGKCQRTHPVSVRGNRVFVKIESSRTPGTAPLLSDRFHEPNHPKYTTPMR
ncbi:unnamed protein product (mitochondrion) [Plasmodiophora brassicae]|uniref:Rieske domain-containing protein n=1 Tax=Plasmodiophora brassicae TaxID=37360 RepID=A0A3P3YJV9_PLABS|nr:unnamed protein product [Plasmodiophora brassicae]